MFGSWVLEVVIGLMFVFFLFSSMCAVIREGIEAWTKTRAAYLERGILEMLHDVQREGLAKEFYEHPLISSLYAGRYFEGKDKDMGKVRRPIVGGTLPSYIPAKNFSAALIDIAARGPIPQPGQTGEPALTTIAITATSLRAGIAEMKNPVVARALLNAVDLAEDDLNKTRLNLEAWYDSGMDRVSGWYKRLTQWIVLLIALILAIALNVDAIGIANFLYRNDNARHAVVAQAEAAVADVRASEASARVQESTKALSKAQADAAADAAAATQAKEKASKAPGASDTSATGTTAAPSATATAGQTQAHPLVEKAEAVKKAEAALDEANKAKQLALAQAKVARERAHAARPGAAPDSTDTASKAENADINGGAPSASPYQLAKLELDTLELPIGWPAEFTCGTKEQRGTCYARGALIVLGWLFTALAATLGAPFWFDTLNKVMVIRSTVKPYEKSRPEASEDHQGLGLTMR